MDRSAQGRGACALDRRSAGGGDQRVARKEKEHVMVGRGLRFLVPTALALLVASQWQDIVRYLKIKQISADRGHPENVSARGRASYPRPGSGEADGHGDFDSTSRGGPHNT